MSLLIHYPAHPIPAAELDTSNPDTLKDLIATCRANAIPFRLQYPHRGPFRYHCDPQRSSRGPAAQPR
jgi:hypothetical protein